MERPKFQVRLEAAVAHREPLTWPIAPDGYIPNSVIRSRRRKGKKLWDDSFFHGQRTDECTTGYKQDKITDYLWFQTENEKEGELKRKKSGPEDERTRKESKKIGWQGRDDTKEEETEKKTEKEAEKAQEKLEVMRKKKTDAKKENGKDETQKFIRTASPVNEQPKPSEDANVAPQKQADDPTNAPDFLPTSCDEKRSKPVRELKTEMELCEVIPKVNDVSEEKDEGQPDQTGKRKESEQEKTGRAETARAETARAERPELQNETYSPLVAPEDPQPQPEPSPIKDQRFLLFSHKYDNIANHVQAGLDDRVLALYKNFKVFRKNLPHLGKLSVPTEHRPYPTQSRCSTLQANAAESSLKGGLYSSPAHVPSQSIVQATCLGGSLSSDLGGDPTFNSTVSTAQIQGCTQLPQTSGPSMTEWRTNLYKLISVHGFQSARAARLHTSEHAHTFPTDVQLVTDFPPLQPQLAAAHQRVVQKIKLKDSVETAGGCFYRIIPMASQHNFLTAQLCGKARYGRLEFDWTRGCDEESVLRVSSLESSDHRAED
ncbi:uncharacterized protein LOC116329942 isoform X1 [Oreochromis aureus]|uniref:uncharacterized protein LOC116329942 isoform X1 n=1 Tax=Oreochromis aureus TaxID=47969 RepID=UPI0012BC0263|nr:uncharacterized protein LOC116329942 isoform X1 [Oreochromis aureus]